MLAHSDIRLQHQCICKHLPEGIQVKRLLIVTVHEIIGTLRVLRLEEILELFQSDESSSLIFIELVSAIT